MARIYVSSTSKDLEECRKKVSLILRQVGHEDVAMEYFVAEDERPLDKCLEAVASSDLYIGIFAWRYGYRPPGYDQSITELEYRKAVECGKKCLIFLLDEAAAWPRKLMDKGDDASKIEDLRNELSTTYIVSFFQSCESLASKVGAAVHNWETEHKAAIKSQQLSNSVFIVHGRDSHTKEITAKFIRNLGLDPIILHEKADKGRTIIEKFEDHSSTAVFAIVLLTPDDIGGLATDPANLSPRARQNVIFELGYFFGKLGRDKVCTLYRGVDKPSDLHGVLHISMDDAEESWQIRLARELKEAGLNVDMNKAINV